MTRRFREFQKFIVYKQEILQLRFWAKRWPELFLAYTLISLSITTKRLKNTKVVTIEVILVKIRNEWVENWDGGGQ